MRPHARYKGGWSPCYISWYYLSKASLNDWSIFRGSIFGLIKLYRGERLLYKKCIFGKGTMFIVISFRSTFRSPSNLIEHVKLLTTFATIEFSFSKLFSFFFWLPLSSTDVPDLIEPASLACYYFIFAYCESTLLTISKSAWLSTGSMQSALFISTLRASIELYGEVITSSSFEGNTHVENLKTVG